MTAGRIYTRTGDDGTTGLGSGARVPKDSLRVESYGTLDELNATLGVVLGCELPDGLKAPLVAAQNHLFDLGGELCMPGDEGSDPNEGMFSRVAGERIEALENLMDQLSESLPALKNFILPGGTRAAQSLHVARTVCRRAERLLVALAREEPVGDGAVQYLNRLSDALFVMARFANHEAGVTDTIWTG